MIHFRKPTPAAIRQFLDEQRRLGPTYQAVGATAGTPPVGHVVDHTRARLGQGEQVFARAKAALARWEQFRLGWVEPWPGDTLLEEGEAVAVLAHVMGVWWLNASRIVYVVDREGPATAFGFAYGTLPGHAESGEERFLVEWDRERDEVWYDILAFSRPNHFLARMGKPWARRTQKRFARDSAAAMRRAAGTSAA